MRRYSIRITIAGYKDDILRLYQANPEYGQEVLEFVNSSQYSIPQNFKLLAAWMRKDPTFDELSVMHSLDHIGDERITYKVNLKSNSITLNDREFNTPLELEEYLSTLVRTSQPEGVSTDINTDLVPVMENQDGSIKVYKITGDNAQLKASELAGDTPWCITKPESGMLRRYRKDKASTFYFVIDKNMEGTKLAKVAIDLNKSEIVELTDLKNFTGSSLTEDIPGEKGRDWASYSSYLSKRGINLGAKNDEGEPLLKNDPLTEKELSDIAFNEKYSYGKFTLEEFQELFKGQNFRDNRPEKLITNLRRHLPLDCLEWLVKVNRPYTNKLIFQYIQSNVEFDENEIDLIRNYPKIFKEYRRVAAVRIKRYKQIRPSDRLIFTNQEFTEILNIYELPLNLVPGEFRTEDVILKRLDDDEIGFDTMYQLKEFPKIITPKIKEKIFSFMIYKKSHYKVNLFRTDSHFYNLFFEKATLNQIAYNVAEFAKDLPFELFLLPRAVVENYKFYELLNKYGYKRWIHAFDSGLVGGMRGLTTAITFLIQAILYDFDFLKVIMDADKNINLRYKLMYAITKTNKELYEKIVSSKYKNFFPLSARTVFKVRGDLGRSEDKIFPTESIYLPGVKKNQKDIKLYQAIKDQVPVGEQIPMQTEQVEQQRNPNKLVDIMKKLDDKGFYGLSDKLTQSLSPNQPLPDQRPRPQDVPVEFED